jgi:hypothetical protein
MEEYNLDIWFLVVSIIGVPVLPFVIAVFSL